MTEEPEVKQASAKDYRKIDDSLALKTLMNNRDNL